MPVIVKNTPKSPGSGTVNGEDRNYDNDPVVLKKVQKAKETIQRVGLPDVKKK